MSYIAKRKLKGAKWIGLARAIDHIRTALGCNSIEAKTELVSALLDGELSARFDSLAWAATKYEYPVPPHIEPIPASFWQSCMIFPIGEGYVVETPLLANELPERRPVLFDNDRLLEIWPPQTVGLKAPHADKTEGPPINRRPVASAVDIRKHLLEIYRTAEPPPNVDKAFYLISDQLGQVGRTTSRSFVREILREPKFVELRRKRGRPQRR